MNSFVFNSFKERFLNGNVPSADKWSFIPMNNSFETNFSSNEFKLEQFRTMHDLTAYNPSAFNESKLLFTPIKIDWSTITITEEQQKPMYIISGEEVNNYDELKQKDEYWNEMKAYESTLDTYAKNGFYILRNKEELNWFANTVNEGNNGITGVLVDDITNNIFARIGKTEEIPFQGTLDGLGHNIVNPSLFCLDSDNGLVGVLGSKGKVCNINICNDGTNASAYVLNCSKQINLDYLKNDARDVNAGVLVGRNYGTIENVGLVSSPTAHNTTGFCFNFSGFVPQVYSVTNKTDAISNFDDVRQKFDNGENFFFLNSWCVNSPGNICPYVGYFAEGIFAQQAYGYDDNNNLAAIDFNPKMKSYYETGSDSIDIDFADAKVTLECVCIYLKYDFYKDYILSKDSWGNWPNNNAVLDYVYTDIGSESAIEYVHNVFDNNSYRTRGLVNNTNSYSGMDKTEMETLLSDPEWLSFNDDPRHRNAVAIMRCEVKDDDGNVKHVYFLEVNGMFIAQNQRNEEREDTYCSFIAGSLDLSTFNVVDNYDYESDSDNKNPFWTFASTDIRDDLKNINKGFRIGYTFGYDSSHGAFCLYPNYYDSNKLNVNDCINEDGYINCEDLFDITDCIRAFDTNGNEVKINAVNGAAIRFRPHGSKADGRDGYYPISSQQFIPINTVFNLNAVIAQLDENTKVKFASHHLGRLTIKDGQENNTHKKIEGEKSLYWKSIIDTGNYNDFVNKFSSIDPDWGINSFFASAKDDDYMFPSAYTLTGDNKHSFRFHSNDYKQHILTTCFSSSGIMKFLHAFKYKNSGTDEQKEEAKQWICTHLEVEHADGSFNKITDAEYNSIKLQLPDYNTILKNLNVLVKFELDFTSVTWASQITSEGKNADDFIHRVNASNHPKCNSRRLIFNRLYNIPNRWDEFKQYFRKRKYNDVFTKKDGMYNSLNFNGSYDYNCQTFSHDPFNADTDPHHVTVGTITVTEFNYQQFMYSPFISCYNNNGTVFDAGRPYSAISGEIFDVANLYVKNPSYYGLDYQGHWTSMCCRRLNPSDTFINQVNFNWNITRRMFEDVYEGDHLFWNGIHYEDDVYPEYAGDTISKWKKVNSDGTVSDYNNEYVTMGVPNSILNKPIRMHNMVRAAYNISPIAGANYGTIRNVSGNVCVTNSGVSGSKNFVGFIGCVAGKNVNGTIQNVNINYTTKLIDEGYDVKYKNTPILPYEATKFIELPEDPNFVDPNEYRIIPNSYLNTVNMSNLITNQDFYKITKSITYYGDITENPNFKTDLDYYNKVKDIKYFTSAWYDTVDDKVTNSADDVISYQLKPIFVLGGIAGRVVASNASGTSTGKIDVKKSIFERIVSNKVNPDYPFSMLPYHDMHNEYGSVIGQVDILTNDTDNKNVDKLVMLNSITTNGKDCIGYVEYQPIDLNTVVALKDWTRGKGSKVTDYFGAYNSVLFAIDQPIRTNNNQDKLKYSVPMRCANINQSTGAFISPATTLIAEDGFVSDYTVSNYYRNVISSVINADNISSSGVSLKFDIPSVYNDKKWGLESVNSVFGSNTLFEPIFKQYKDEINDPSINHLQEELIVRENVGYRFYKRNQYSYSTSAKSSPNLPNITGVNTSISTNNDDVYFSYTYTSAYDEDAVTLNKLSANMFNDIDVKFNGFVDTLYYVADFDRFKNTSGDGFEYIKHNYLAFGESLSPNEIRSRLTNNNGKFTSYLFSAYQVNDSSEKVQADSEHQLGGFLVKDSNNNLVMFIGNENNSEIDGRSYNLRFDQANNLYNTGGVVLSVKTS